MLSQLVRRSSRYHQDNVAASLVLVLNFFQEMMIMFWKYFLSGGNQWKIYGQFTFSYHIGTCHQQWWLRQDYRDKWCPLLSRLILLWGWQVDWGGGWPCSHGGGISQLGLKPMHYGIRAMGAMTLRNLELCPSFSPHPNISDGNFNLVHHFFACKYFR